MDSLFVGVAKVVLYIRHARTLKDRRQVTSGLKQKLINRGFSVTEISEDSQPQHVTVAFCCVGTGHEATQSRLRDGVDLFFGNYELVSSDMDVFDYSFERENPNYLDEKYDP